MTGPHRGRPHQRQIKKLLSHLSPFYVIVPYRTYFITDRKPLMPNMNGNPEFLPKRGPGRPKGSTNKYTKTVKDALLQSFENQGGVEFWDKLAKKDPRLYAQCLVRLIPAEVNAEMTANVQHGVVDLAETLQKGRERVRRAREAQEARTIELEAVETSKA